jgi:internalin A
MKINEGKEKQNSKTCDNQKKVWIHFRRKVLVMLLLMGWLIIGYVHTQQLHFVDAHLEELVREVSGRKTGRLFSWQMSEIEMLDAKGKSISDLDGIGRLKNLRWLSLEDNEINDVAPLAELSHLEYLSLRNNGITCLESIQLAALSHLPLTGLSLRHNVIRYPDGSQIRLQDISVLRKFHQLEYLELRDNQITDASPLAGLVNLRILDISQNPLSDPHCEFLTDLVLLEELNLRECGVETLEFLSCMINLKYLNVHSNSGIRTFVPMLNLYHLETLLMANTHLGDDVWVLKNMHDLTRLNIRNCDVEDLTVLAQLMASGSLQNRLADGILAEVDIEDNPVPRFSETGIDGYRPIRIYWHNIHLRNPNALPD